MKTAGQRRVIHHFVSGRDVFVSLPTGYGKLFCYAFVQGNYSRCIPDLMSENFGLGSTCHALECN